MIDAHLHLQDERLDAVRETYLADLPRLGIEWLGVNGTCEADWDAVEQLAARESRVVPFFGLHPWKAGAESPEWFRDLEERIQRHPRAGVGEVGLDRWIRDGDFERQKEVFAMQLDLAVRHARPLALHCLQAWGTLLEMCRAAGPPRGMLLHSYGGPAEMVAEFLEMGAWFSISGYFFRPGKEAKRDVFRTIPLDRLLIETDSPDMALPGALCRYPVPDDTEGTLNHPGNLGAIHAAVASIRGMEVGELTECVARNFRTWIGQAETACSSASDRLSTP